MATTYEWQWDAAARMYFVDDVQTGLRHYSDRRVVPIPRRDTYVTTLIMNMISLTTRLTPSGLGLEMVTHRYLALVTAGLLMMALGGISSAQICLNLLLHRARVRRGRPRQCPRPYLSRKVIRGHLTRLFENPKGLTSSLKQGKYSVSFGPKAREVTRMSTHLQVPLGQGILMTNGSSQKPGYVLSCESSLRTAWLCQ